MISCQNCIFSSGNIGSQREAYSGRRARVSKLTRTYLYIMSLQNTAEVLDRHTLYIMCNIQLIMQNTRLYARWSCDWFLLAGMLVSRNSDSCSLYWLHGISEAVACQIFNICESSVRLGLCICLHFMNFSSSWLLALDIILGTSGM